MLFFVELGAAMMVAGLWSRPAYYGSRDNIAGEVRSRLQREVKLTHRSSPELERVAVETTDMGKREHGWEVDPMRYAGEAMQAGDLEHALGDE